MDFKIENNEIYFICQGEIVRLSACGRNSIRFQASPNCCIENINRTLMPQNEAASARIENNRAILETGDMRAEIYNNGKVVYYYRGRKIIEEKPELTFGAQIRNYRNIASGLWKARVTFEPNENEHFYGLGHEATDCFDLKGCTIDLRHVNAKCVIPFVYSSLGYGFLWNMPSTGRCELANNRTRWTSDCTGQLDYVVMGGTPREVSGTLADLTGHAPVMPHWATGLWQSRLRYETQDEVLSIARRYKELGIPLSVIVIDYFHWTEQGDYRFDPKYWPNPKAMADELHDMGVKLMVSVWPTINNHSENYREMLDNNMLIRTVNGTNKLFDFYGPQALIDPTNPETRSFVWDKLKKNYIDNGVDALWFDEAEPEIHPEHFDNLILFEGRGDEVGLIYPYYYAKLAYDGMKEIGRDDIVTLSRCAYIGAQKFGTLVWSGDIPSTFKSLASQVKSGLNMAMCGIPWWTTDIGGFYGGDINSDYFRELIVRWFQYGVFCPVTRLHGSRNGHDRTRDIIEPTGGENELWSFGGEVFEILKALVGLRERLRPYTEKHLRIASEQGVPVMRPMFYDYPCDEECYKTGEQYMFGDDIIFAPIVNQGQTEREVYLPAGEWIFARDRQAFHGGRKYCMKAAIDEIIVFIKKGAEVIDIFMQA
ncbi:MAG: TIM-barrel domain-containing protein [Candidatus Ornithomonoglobus sp.]